MAFTDDMTLGEAKEEADLQFSEGRQFKCPVCRRQMGQYLKSLTPSMAQVLGWIYRESGGDTEVWVLINKEVDKELIRARDWWALKLWNFTTQRGRVSRNKGDYGEYRITSEGVKFVTGGTLVPKGWWTRDKVVYGEGPKGMTTYKEALKKLPDLSLVVK